MKDIRIFVASSKELIAERNQLAFLVLSMEEEFASRGLRVRLAKWEYVDPKMTEERTEDRYLEEMYDSDAALVLFKTLIGKYTREETEKALERERGGYARLKAHRILFKEGDGAPTPELSAWRAELKEGEYGVFTDFAGLKAELLALVDRLVELDASGEAGKHLHDAPPDAHVRRITAFLAVDEELAADRDAFADTVLNLNDLLEFRNLRVQLRFCPPGLPRDALRELVSGSEMGLVLYGTNVRAFGREEMDDATERTRRGENPKKLYVFFRDDGGRELSEEFVRFRDSFVERLGHFVCQFGGADSLRLSFLLSLERYAGETVEIYSTVSAPTAPTFVGREAELRRLADLLAPTRAFPAGRLPVVTGAGGTGKSELVRQFASQLRVQYPGGVFQVDMETCMTWDDAFLGILKGTPNNGIKVEECLGLKGDGDPKDASPLDGSAVRDALLKRSRSAGPVLLVLDNVEGCEDLLGEDDAFAKAFPSGFSERVSVNVVATARTCDVPLREDGWAQAFPLGDLSPEAALELLFADRKADTEEERKAAKRVAELLGRRALFLRRVPAILKGVNKKARIVCRTYAKLAEALERDALGTINKTGTVDQSYWPGRLWEIVQGSLAEWGLGEACVKLVKIASYFSPDGFPRQLLRHLWDELVYPGLEDWGDREEVFDQVVDLAKSYNLFQSADPVRIHRLDRAAILQTAKAEPGLEDAIGKSLASYGLLLKEDWAFLFEHEKIRLHLPDELAQSGGFWGSMLIEHPGYADCCHWEKLSGSDWSRLLRVQPQFANQCAWEKLDGGDWRRLLRGQPQFADLCAWDKLSGEDWALLLVNQPQFANRCPWERIPLRDWSLLIGKHPQFAEHCPWDELQGWGSLVKDQPQLVDKVPWGKLGVCDMVEILCDNPQFADRCNWENLRGGDWSKLLCAQPHFADRCAWEKLDGSDWCPLLCKRPEFAIHCDWAKLDSVGWSWLLKDQPLFADRCDMAKLEGWALGGFIGAFPRFAEECPWENIDGEGWSALLRRRPEFSDRCVWEKLGGGDWRKLLSAQPQFADRCPWEKLDGSDWCGLLCEQPQFAGRCAWEKLSGRDLNDLLGHQPFFVDRIPFEKLNVVVWGDLLREQPQLVACCPWANLDGTAWSKLLSRQPQFADRCPWDKLCGQDWRWLLKSQPQFVDFCDWIRPLDKSAVPSDAEDWRLPIAIVQRPELLDSEDVRSRFESLLALGKDGRHYAEGEKHPVVFFDDGRLVDVDGRKTLRCGLVDPWTYVLYYRPELASRCTTLQSINGMSRCTLLRRHPQFAEVWSMEELASRSGACWANLRVLDFRLGWERLVSAQPQFAKWREGSVK